MRKRLTILLIVFFLGFTTPFFIAYGGVPIIDLASIGKEYGLDTVARAIARKALTALSKSTIDSINTLGTNKSGKTGFPKFVENWKGFLADAQTTGENQFRAQLSYSVDKGILCKDLQDPLAKGFGAKNIRGFDIGNTKYSGELKQGTLVPYQTKVKCTVPEKTRKAFSENFEKGGGWKTWSRLMEPQNNLAGALAISLEELSKQRGSQQEARKSEVVAGSGFSGVQDACRNIDVTESSCYQRCIKQPEAKYTAAFCKNECAGDTGGAESQCTFLGKTVTPAKLLGEASSNWLDANSKWLVTSDELSEVLIDILNAALNKLGNFATKGFTNSKGVEGIIDVIQSCTSEYCAGEKYDGNKAKSDFRQEVKDTAKEFKSSSGCFDVDDNNEINEQDCGAPGNENCSLCQ